MHTGQSEIHSNVILCIFGDEETTANLPLKTTKDGSQAMFEKESSLEFDVQAADVGKVMRDFCDVISVVELDSKNQYWT